MHMSVPTMMPPKSMLHAAGIAGNAQLHYQLDPTELVQQTIALGQGVLNDIWRFMHPYRKIYRT